jgi:hypothetical protein
VAFFSLLLFVQLINLPLIAQDWSAVEVQSDENHELEQPKIKKEVLQEFKIEAGKNILQEQTVTEYNIHGKMIQFSAYKADSTGQASLHSQEIIKFDRNGNRIGSMRFNKDKALIWSEELELNEEGLLIKRQQTSYETDASKSYITHYKYAVDNQLTAKSTYNENKELIAEYRKTYNQSGELMHVSAWSYQEPESKSEKQSMRSHYDYDRRGNLKKAVTELQRNKERWKDVRRFENNFVVEWWQYKNGEEFSHFKHDKRGNLPPMHDYELPPPIPYHTPFEYDDSKRDPLQYIDHVPGQTISIKTNAKGLPIKEVLRFKQQIISVTYFFYNEHDQLIRKKKVFKQEKDIEEVKFHYDHYNNLSQELTYLNDQLVAERSFKYEYYR